MSDLFEELNSAELLHHLQKHPQLNAHLLHTKYLIHVENHKPDSEEKQDANGGRCENNSIKLIHAAVPFEDTTAEHLRRPTRRNGSISPLVHLPNDLIG